MTDMAGRGRRLKSCSDLSEVGDLSKLVQGMNGVRATPDLNTKVAHELADCLWSVFTLADCYGVELGQAFSSTMEAVNGWLDEQGKTSQR